MLANLLLVIAGLVLLIWGADRFVHGAAATARNLGIAPLMIGLTVVAFATSAPEILVSVVAALQGEPGLAFGNAIGSNIVNIGLVLGMTAMIRPIRLESATLAPSVLSLHIFVMVAFTLVLFAMTYDYDGKSKLSRIEGFALLAAYIAYDVYVVVENV